MVTFYMHLLLYCLHLSCQQRRLRAVHVEWVDCDPVFADTRCACLCLCPSPRPASSSCSAGSWAGARNIPTPRWWPMARAGKVRPASYILIGPVPRQPSLRWLQHTSLHATLSWLSRVALTYDLNTQPTIDLRGLVFPLLLTKTGRPLAIYF